MKAIYRTTTDITDYIKWLFFRIKHIFYQNIMYGEKIIELPLDNREIIYKI